jgi:PAS domain S-box-containing protein
MKEAEGLLGPFWKLASSVDAIIYVAGLQADRPLLFVSPAVERFFGYTPDEWLATPLLQHLHPEDGPDVLDAVTRWLQGNLEQPLHLKYRLAARDGRVCWCRETVLAVGSEGGPRTQIVGAIVDVTELKVLQNTLESVAGAEEPHEAVLAFCDALAQALACDWTAWISPGDARMVATHGPLGVRQSVEWLQWREAPDLGLRCMKERRVVFTEANAAVESPALCDKLPEARFALAAPVPGSDGPRGALMGLSREPRVPSPHQVRVAEALAQQAAVALQRAELIAEIERTSRDRQRLADEMVRAHEEERSRLARELHDGAGQTLTAVAIQLDLAERHASPELRGPLTIARRQVEQTLEELRRLSHSLRPAALDRLGLGEALAEMCKALDGPALSVELELPESALQLPPQHATALFRIAQSALTNVVRHAAARTATVRVELDTAQHQVALEVEDDGRGFVPAYAPGALGLIAMRERAVALGGQFALQAAPGAGTQVRAVLPLP